MMIIPTHNLLSAAEGDDNGDDNDEDRGARDTDSYLLGVALQPSHDEIFSKKEKQKRN
jgi:hypothetical protein